MSLLDSAIVRLLPAVPKPVVQRFSARYIAGATLAEAVAVVRDLNAGGKMATVDVLGEEITREEETRAIAQAYRDVLAAIDEESLDSNVSIKPTALGLGLSYELCRENLLDILRAPGTSCASTWRTRRRPTTRCGCTASCARTGTTTSASSSRRGCGGRSTTSPRSPTLRPSVRICKGIYLEPAAIAFTDAEAIRVNFLRCLDALLDGGSYVGIATHDEWLIGESLARVSQRGLGREEYELQMLLGVREERRDELVAEGHRLRVYVPYGEQWYEYSVRRLQENPAMAGTIAKATASRLLRGR